MRDDLKSGATFPDLELPDRAGNLRLLSELAGGDPLVLTFYRGWWCPREQSFFRRLVEFQDVVEVAYTRMVSVSVDPPEVESAFRVGLGARWTFLSDAERRYLDDLDLLETTDTIHHPYVPTAFTLYPDLTIGSAWNGYWTWGGRRSRSCAAISARSRRRPGPTGRCRRHELALARADGRGSGRGARLRLALLGRLSRRVPSDGRAAGRAEDRRARDRPRGRPGSALLVLPPDGVTIAFDDPAVGGALRAVPTVPWPDVLSTLVVQSSRFAGALTAVRDGDRSRLESDTFARTFPAEIVEVGPGLLGATPAPTGPVIQRYGGGNPWPWDRSSVERERSER